jgi:hypothetical protein
MRDIVYTNDYVFHQKLPLSQPAQARARPRSREVTYARPILLRPYIGYVACETAKSNNCSVLL